MGFLDKRNNKLRIVCAGICVIITVLLSGCSEEGSNINISEDNSKQNSSKCLLNCHMKFGTIVNKTYKI